MPETPTPEGVSVVIPAYNAGKTIGEAIRGALGQELPGLEVIVVDDGSTDETAAEASRHRVRCIRQENAGPAAARNTGWRASRGAVVLFTDADCVPRGGWAAALCGALEEGTAGAATGSYALANRGSTLAVLIHEEIVERHRRYGRRVKFFGSYNVALKREVLEETGGFSEAFRRPSGEDNDLSYRLLEKGYGIVYVPGALVAHRHTESLARYLGEQYRHGFWRVKLYRDRPWMLRGDDYTRVKDVVEPPLALLSLALLILLPFAPAIPAAALGALGLLQLPVAMRVSLRRRRPGLLLLAPATFLRAFARGLGMLHGLVDFFLIRRPRGHEAGGSDPS